MFVRLYTKLTDLTMKTSNGIVVGLNAMLTIGQQTMLCTCINSDGTGVFGGKMLLYMCKEGRDMCLGGRYLLNATNDTHALCVNPIDID